MRKLLAAAVAMFLTVLPAVAQTNATDQQVEINGQVSFGLSYFGNTNLLNYAEPGTTTAKFQGSAVVMVPPSTTDQAVSLSSLFANISTPICIGLKDISNPGQQCNWGMAAAGTRFNMAAGGFSLMRVNGSRPTLYLDNPSSTSYCIVQVFCMGN